MSAPNPQRVPDISRPASRLALAIVLLLVTVPAHALSHRTLVAPTGLASEGLGNAVGGGGDVNGDGHPDLLVGAPSGAGGLGRVYVYYGGPASDSIPDLTITGPVTGTAFGLDAENAGDVNGDGFDDVIVGAYLDDTGGADAGRAFVYFGGPLADTTPDLTLTGVTAGDNFGFSVSGAGDTNGDGFDDVIVGAYKATSSGTPNVGAAYLYFGGAAPNNVFDRKFGPIPAGTEFGAAVGGGGDFNGDGLADVVVGAPRDDTPSNDWGNVYLYLGTPNTFSTSADATFASPSQTLTLGTSVSLGSDFNGDGYADLVAGAPYDLPSGGRALVFLGGNTINTTMDYSLRGPGTYDYFGLSVAGVGDVDGDGYGDILVGAPRETDSDNTGHAYLFLGGSAPNVIPDLVLSGGATGQKLGQNVAAIGDLDGDGRADFAVGVPGASPGGRAYATSVFPYRVLSPNGGERWVAGRPATVRWQGDARADLQLSLDGGFTWETRVSGIGGADENAITITAPAGATDAAKVRLVYSGGTPSRANSDEGDAAFSIVEPHLPPRVASRNQLYYTATGFLDYFGTALAGVGDVNGDRYPDILLGSPRDDAAGSDAGRAFLHFGGPSADNAPELSLYGQLADDYFGLAVGGAGDVNRDGFADFIVGAYGNDAVAANAGRAFVYYGGASVNATPDLLLSGTGANQYFGTAVGSAGDINRDGFPDLFVGDANSSGATSKVFVYFGGVPIDAVPDLTLSSGVIGDYFGYSAANVGDMNGDGYTDLIVGAQASNVMGALSGRAYVFFGGATPDAIPDLVMDGTAAGDYFGNSVGAAGDVDGDGYSDVVVGAYATLVAGAYPGRAYVFLGGPAPDDQADLVLTGTTTGEVFGYAVGAAGDVNADGFDDFFVGAQGSSAGAPYSGRLDVFLGGPGVDGVADVVLPGAAAEEAFGAAAAAAGDVNGDGFDDLLVGASGSDAGGFDSGRVSLVDFKRYFLTSPNGGETWNVGATQVVSWLGGEPADLWLSVDAGHSYERLRQGVGGNASNSVSLLVPHAPTKFALMKLTPVRADASGQDESDLRFTILSSVALLSFTATLSGDAAELAWSTDPGPGAEGIAGYRLYRSGPDESGNGVLIGPELITVNHYTDAGGGPGSRYRLVAVNGLMEELELGHASLAPAVPLAASPLPLQSGDLTISFAVYGMLGSPNGEVLLELYDLAGRRVSTIARGGFEAGYRTVRWNGQDDSGAPVSNGVYFLRTRSAGVENRMRIVVAR